MYSSNPSLEAKILEALAYFDIFSYPLTRLEIWQNIQMRAAYHEVEEALQESEWLRKRIVSHNGLWHLKKATGDPILERENRYRISTLKFKKALRFAQLLRFVPWIEAVYACNSLGFFHAKPESDIDLFIITRPGRIWTSRFFSVLLAELTGFRPKDNHAKDGLCLSFFAVVGAPIESVALGKDDLYFFYWMTKLAPLFVRGQAHERFWGENQWVQKMFPQMEMMRPPSTYHGSSDSAAERLGRVEWFGNWLETKFRRLQLRLMPAYLKDAAGQGTGVIINNEFLKFHDHDRREQFRKQYEQKLAAVAG